MSEIYNTLGNKSLLFFFFEIYVYPKHKRFESSPNEILSACVYLRYSLVLL